MAKLTQDQVKALFETDDMPTQSDFNDLIDTLKSNSAVILTTLAGTGDVWADFNTEVTMTQETQEIHLITHNGTFYMFNGDVGIFGIGNTQTDTTNFVPISTEYQAGQLEVQTIYISNTDATTMSATTLATDLAGLDPPIIHSSNMITIIAYGDDQAYMMNLWYMLDAPPDTYGAGGSTITESQLILSGINRYEKAVTPMVVDVANQIDGYNVSQDFNIAETVNYSPNILYIINHYTGVYLFNFDPSDAKGEYNSWGAGGGATSTTQLNFKLIISKSQVLRSEYVSSALPLAGTGYDLDFRAYQNFNIMYTGNDGTDFDTVFTYTASNFEHRDGQSGYIRVSRNAGSALGAATYLTFDSADFFTTEVTPSLNNTSSAAYYKYTIMADGMDVPNRILVTGVSEHIVYAGGGG